MSTFPRPQQLVFYNTFGYIVLKGLGSDRIDAFVILPGGLGTLEELAEILSLRTLRQRDKPIVIFNQDGFYAPLLAFFDHLCEHRFAHTRCRQAYHVADTIDAIFDHLAAPREPHQGDKSDLWTTNRTQK